MSLIHAPESSPGFVLPFRVSPGQFHDRCSNRICFSPATSPTGERAYGYFIMNADVLAEALFNLIPSPSIDAESSGEALLYQWVRACDRHDHETTRLSQEWPGIEAAVEYAFLCGRAYAFCLGCNCKYLYADIRRHPRPVCREDAAPRYVCPHGHLLLALPHDSHAIPRAIVA